MEKSTRRSLLFGFSLAAATLLFGPSALGQTSDNRPPNCPAVGPCPTAVAPNTPKIGARIRLARDLIETTGLDSPVFGPRGAPADTTREHVGASLRFTGVLDDSRLKRIRRLGVEFTRNADGTISHFGPLYLARIPWSALEELAALDFLVRAEATWTPKIETPLEITSDTVGASSLRRSADFGLTGEGTVLGDIDSSFDIYHPHLFRADGDWHRWVDVDDDGNFDPGEDGVDLDGDGSIGSDEELEVLDATVWAANGRVNDDDVLQPGKDWLYVDVNGDGKRNVGPDEGFDESDPAYGEPLFVADDLDDDGKLGPNEKIVRLDSSKFKRIFNGETEYVRGENLVELGKPESGERADHGTGVASILVGGQHRFHDRVGLAPEAEIIGYPHASVDRNSTGGFGTQQQFVQDAAENDVDVLVHEWTDLFATPQDGSTNVEQALDAAREQGTVQINPLGNLNLSRKHVEFDVAPSEQSDVSFRVDDGFQRGGQSYPYRVLWGSFLWRTDQTPTVTLVSPQGNRLELDPSQRRQSIGDHGVSAEYDVSPRETHQLLFVLWDRQNSLDPGTWTFEFADASEDDTITGRISDRYSSWGVGIRWTNPTKDRGTMVFPSTADSALGVAAFGGRHDMPGDGSGSNVGELRNYSGRGPRIDGARGVDIAAPDDPFAAFGVSERYTERGVGRSWFRRFGGTSGAGPHVAAAVALLQEANPSWGPEQLESRLLETTDSAGLVPDAGSVPNTSWGHGKVNLYEAVADESEPGPGAPPAAALTIERRDGEWIFDASESEDPEGAALEYRFDYDYDGVWDRDWQAAPTGAVPPSFFERTGEHIGRVEVRDELGNRSGASDGFEVTNPGGDAGPDTGDGAVAEPTPGESDTETSARADAAGGADAGPVVAVYADDDSQNGGCSGCRSGDSTPGAAWLLGLFALGIVGLRRD